jgi:hypothetical protein
MSLSEIPVSETMGVSRPTRRTTRSMAKETITPRIQFFPKEPNDVSASPEAEYERINNTSETKEHTLKDLVVK